MRKFASLVVAASVVASAFVAAPALAFAGETGSTQDISCLTTGKAEQLKVRWERPAGNRGRCNGFVSASDFAKVAKLAVQGHTKFMIRFEVEHCESGLAKMPAFIKNGVLTNQPWFKTCLPEGQEFATRAR